MKLAFGTFYLIVKPKFIIAKNKYNKCKQGYSFFMQDMTYIL